MSKTPDEAATDAAFAARGMCRVASTHDVATSLDRLEAALRRRNLKVFGRLDHAAAAAEYGLEMPAAVVLVFGNPKIGTPAMRVAPSLAIDVPPKALVYEDGGGKVWIAYNTAAYLFETIYRRHGLDAPEGAVEAFSRMIADVVAEAAG
jgi:uncharacterized protein (DUF302 family)